MSETPWDVVEQAKLAGRQVKADFVGDGDIAKAHRSLEAYGWFIALQRHYKRINVLMMMDPNKNGGPKQPTMFGVSERHIRRVETIMERRPKQFVRLMEIAKSGTVSLETIEHLALHPSTDLVEVVWLILDNSSKP